MRAKTQQVKKQNNRKEKLNSRASEKEYREIENKAIKHANGNISEWIRLAALNYEPKG